MFLRFFKLDNPETVKFVFVGYGPLIQKCSKLGTSFNTDKSRLKVSDLIFKCTLLIFFVFYKTFSNPFKLLHSDNVKFIYILCLLIAVSSAIVTIFPDITFASSPK